MWSEAAPAAGDVAAGAAPEDGRYVPLLEWLTAALVLVAAAVPALVPAEVAADWPQSALVLLLPPPGN
jgi:hypothetical protein